MITAITKLNKTESGKIHLIKFSQRKVINDTSISMYVQPLKFTQSIKFFGVFIENQLNMKL